MDALTLIELGRRLAKIGEEALRGGSGPPMPTGRSLVLRDVFAHPGSSISDITARTGLPQGYVSESVAGLREQGLVEKTADPADGRRTLVRISPDHPPTVAQKGAVPVDAALMAVLGGPDGGALVATLELVARRLRASQGEPGSILRELGRARPKGPVD